AQQVEIDSDGPRRDGVALFPAVENLVAGAALPAQMQMQALDAARSPDGVGASALAAAAGKSGDGDFFAGLRQDGNSADNRAMAPFGGHPARALNQPSADHQPAANPGAKDDAHHHVMAPSDADIGFGQRKAVGIIGHQNPTAQKGTQFT